MQTLFNGFVGMINSALATLSSVLPVSPFLTYLSFSERVPILGLLNYFVPIAQIVAVTQLWALALLSYKGVDIVARWVKLIK